MVIVQLNIAIRITKWCFKNCISNINIPQHSLIMILYVKNMKILACMVVSKLIWQSQKKNVPIYQKKTFLFDRVKIFLKDNYVHNFENYVNRIEPK